ncbi:hypothetical protein ALI144C_28245 [Actinosynnema sp. ALI-1.44]|uniref:hypothetical protein n=1 Tax=Actinosynnema sp. ALI-1.44 TaxID=1933779 RepID=UPI00097CA9BC|nr:hypothetical protein [Actinosynnema sp. ALI-1.44]ONI78690.1 hypothetical protein ALI144C_28245 [Actinosynnema sp. ALI-1.44]
MAMNDADYMLPCGRDVETVWDRLTTVDAGAADEHDLSCPHCAATRDSLCALRSAVDELAAETVEPPSDLVGRIMSAVRADSRRRDMLPLPSQAPNEARISAQAIASVLRFAADTVEGVRARRCKVRQSGSPDSIEVELSIAVSYRGLAAGAYDLVRERVANAVAARIGVRLSRLDIVVADVFDA